MPLRQQRPPSSGASEDLPRSPAASYSASSWTEDRSDITEQERRRDGRHHQSRHHRRHHTRRERSGDTEQETNDNRKNRDRDRDRDRPNRDRERDRERDRDRYRDRRDRDQDRDRPTTDWERDRAQNRYEDSPPRNWAEEVVKAAMEPTNQWDWGPARSTPTAARRGNGPAWEQPRQRRERRETLS